MNLLVQFSLNMLFDEFDKFYLLFIYFFFLN